MISEVFRQMFSARIQTNSPKLTQMDNDPKHIMRPTQEVFKTKKSNILQQTSQSPDLGPTELSFQLLRTKVTTERPTNVQQLKEAAVKAHSLVIPMSSRLQTSVDCKDFHPSVGHYGHSFTVMSLCPNVFDPLKMEVLRLK